MSSASARGDASGADSADSAETMTSRNEVDVERAWSHWVGESSSSPRWFDAWREALRQTHLDWSLRRPKASQFRAALERRDVAEGRIVHCQCDPLEGRRAAAEIARSDGAFFGIVLVTAGKETITWPGGDLELATSTFALWDSERPLAFVVRERLEKVSLFVPKERFRRILPDVEAHLGRAVDAREGAAALAANQLRALVRHAKALGAACGAGGAGGARLGVAERVLDGTLELFGAALAAGHTASDDRGQHARQRARIKAWVVERLADPELSPDVIATAHGISVRTLHAWFQADGVSLSRWILGERLERCRRDLARRDGAHVTEIAFRWGFNDAAYFSRAFKRRFGCSPRSLRDAS